MSLSLCPRWRNKIYLFVYLIIGVKLTTVRNTERPLWTSDRCTDPSAGVPAASAPRGSGQCVPVAPPQSSALAQRTHNRKVTTYDTCICPDSAYAQP